MGGTVFFRFKSNTQYFSIPIDGERVAVMHFKKMIRQMYHMARDDLRVFQKDSCTEYNDHDCIQASSTVILVRMPIPMLEPIVVSSQPKPTLLTPQYIISDTQRTRQPSGGCVPPAHYICHRCHQPGHYIKFCPTNGNPEYERKQ
jgi:E3 ubiquitin-protein ligase RBBP6